MQKNIMIIPLDERPCNYNYVQYLAKDTDYNLLIPPKELLGDKKIPGNIIRLHQWMKDNINQVEHLILSFDMILYGGIVPSRLHYLSIDEILERLSIIYDLKTINPKLTIDAFTLIMRNPTYSSNDEEPDYYQDYGKEIHLKGVYEHKMLLNTITLEEQNHLKEIDKTLPIVHYLDYVNRRAVNTNVNLEILKLLKENIIDFLVIPQDDASPFGLTKQDQEIILTSVKNNAIFDNFLSYPDADAVGCSLLARFINTHQKKEPKIFVHYAVEEARNLIPLFEDRPLYQSIKSQISVVRAVQVDCVEDADLILAVNATTVMCGISSIHNNNYDYEYHKLRNVAAFIQKVKSYSKPIIMADIAYANGSDEVLIKELKKENLLFSLAAYAGWNTSGNTLGTALAQGVVYHRYKNTVSHKDFLGLRYIEDYIYMTKIRQLVSQDMLPALGLNYFNSGGKTGLVSNTVQKLLQQYASEVNDSNNEVRITKCTMPWSRMFEVEIDVTVLSKKQF